MLANSNLLKIPLILLNAVSVHVAFTSPNPPPQPDEMRKFTASGAGDAVPLMKFKGPLIQKVRDPDLAQDSGRSRTVAVHFLRLQPCGDLYDLATVLPIRSST